MRRRAVQVRRTELALLRTRFVSLRSLNGPLSEERSDETKRVLPTGAGVARSVVRFVSLRSLNERFRMLNEGSSVEQSFETGS